MPDADDFEVENLRRMLRGETGKAASPPPAPPAATKAKAQAGRKTVKSTAPGKKKRR